MSTLKTNAITSRAGSDLSLSGDGDNVVDIEANFKIGGSSGIPTASIQDNAVTLDKLASGTDGNLISYDASGNPVAIATGNDGQVLTSTGAGSPPAFEDAAGGSWVTRASANFTASTSVVWSLSSVVAGPVKLIIEAHSFSDDTDLQIMGYAGSAGGWVNGGHQWSLNIRVTDSDSTWNVQANDVPGKPMRYYNASAGDASRYIIEYMFTDLVTDDFRKSGFWTAAGGAPPDQDDHGSPMYHFGAVSWLHGNDDEYNGFEQFRIVPSDGNITGSYHMLQLA